jgi:hypothetical protein
MSRRWWGYLAYVVGSSVFLVAAVVKGSPLLLVGSALFLLGTLIFALPELVREARDGRRRAPDRGAAGG